MKWYNKELIRKCYYIIKSDIFTNGTIEIKFMSHLPCQKKKKMKILPFQWITWKINKTSYLSTHTGLKPTMNGMPKMPDSCTWKAANMNLKTRLPYKLPENNTKLH